MASSTKRAKEKQRKKFRLSLRGKSPQERAMERYECECDICLEILRESDIFNRWIGGILAGILGAAAIGTIGYTLWP